MLLEEFERKNCSAQITLASLQENCDIMKQRPIIKIYGSLNI